MTKIEIKRAYDPESPGDGFRVYIDRLWPRGLSHETFHYDIWEKEIAPSDELRHWFHENPDANWNEFEDRYRKELNDNPDFKTFVKSIHDRPMVSLLYSSKNEKENNAVVVASTLKEQFPSEFK